MSIIFPSCKEKRTQGIRDDSNILFLKTVEFLVESNSKIELMKDSLELEDLTEQIEKGLTLINFSVLPETDLKLSQQQNDSIIKLLDIYNQKVKKKRKEIQNAKIASETDEGVVP